MHTPEEWTVLSDLARELGVSRPAVYTHALSRIDLDTLSADDYAETMRGGEEGERRVRLAIRHTDGEWEEVATAAERVGVSVANLYRYALARLVDDRSSNADEDGVLVRDRPRTRRTIIRHTDEEWARVTAMAQHLGVSVPGLYERAMFAGSAQAAVGVEEAVLGMLGARRLLANAANNLNQIAKAVNSGAGWNQVQYEQTLALFRRAIEELRTEIENLHRFVPGVEDELDESHHDEEDES